MRAATVASMLLSAQHLLVTYGVLGIGVILFLETGLLFGIILPGETLTVLAGAYSHGSGPAGTHPNLALVIGAAGLGAIAGGQLGYLLGRRAGPRLFARPDGVLFSRSRLDRTREYFRRYGVNAIMIGRFVPFLRTLVSPAAGVGGMPARQFVPFNALGGAIWAVAIATIGYAIGGLISVDRYALLVTIGIAVVSLIPLGLEVRAIRAQDRPGAA
jgi:membrane-associated protein